MQENEAKDRPKPIRALVSKQRGARNQTQRARPPLRPNALEGLENRAVRRKRMGSIRLAKPARQLRSGGAIYQPDGVPSGWIAPRRFPSPFRLFGRNAIARGMGVIYESST